MVLKSQVTNKVPIFEVSNIDPGVPIKLYLYAENAKGTSDPAIIDDSSQNQQKHYVEGICVFCQELIHTFIFVFVICV